MDLDWYIIQAVQPLPNTEIFKQLSDSGEINPARFDDVRYSLGYYGKLKDEKKNVMATDFDRVFELAPPDSIASPAELSRVWAYMNYHLNFRRLFDETRPAKLDQLGRWLEFVGELVTPDGAIVQYFRAYVHKKLSGSAPPEVVRRLRGILRGSADWRERLAGLELSPDDLERIPAVAPRRS
jgi:hypothetical protein